ncbi:hypothetical protein IG557_18260 [Vibrio cholerae]|uniref:hypothetical protein n=1 Tax=Vibrio cholerae TaxID=666 RepID=UPI00227178BA|nr:hypothetical protein [Vibrio cholerae]MCX9560771.1 hypothetical protein [Vibrio cholerae]MCX9565350.1 hypothetical protein [Vibrio cholerae]
MRNIFNNGLTSPFNLREIFSNVKHSFDQRSIAAIKNTRELGSKSVAKQHLQLIKMANSQEYLNERKAPGVTIIKRLGTPSRKKNRAPDPRLRDLVKSANTPSYIQKTKAEGVTIVTVSEK